MFNPLSSREAVPAAAHSLGGVQGAMASRVHGYGVGVCPQSHPQCPGQGRPLLPWQPLAKGWLSLALVPPVPTQIPLLGLLPTGIRCPWAVSHAHGLLATGRAELSQPCQPRGLCQEHSFDCPGHLPPVQPRALPWAPTSGSPCPASGSG